MSRLNREQLQRLDSEVTTIASSKDSWGNAVDYAKDLCITQDMPNYRSRILNISRALVYDALHDFNNAVKAEEDMRDNRLIALNQRIGISVNEFFNDNPESTWVLVGEVSNVTSQHGTDDELPTEEHLLALTAEYHEEYFVIGRTPDIGIEGMTFTDLD